MKNKQAVENLTKARKLIKDENNWTTGYLALDIDGNEVSPRSKKAVAFCALGAVRHIDGPGEKKAIKFLIEVANGRTGQNYKDSTSIFEVNDEGEHADTIDMFTQAIRLAKKQ